MDIVIKPVKCGDCNIVRGKSEQLLIDCGSDNSHNGLCSSEFAFNAIHKEIFHKELTDIMITHFHKDHFNGVLEIPNTYRFKTAYLPYSIINGEILFSKGIGRLLAIASPRSWGFRLSRNILNLFEKLEVISNNICFVKSGDKILFDGDEIRILWPEVIATKFRYGDLPVKLTTDISQMDFRKNYFFWESERPTKTLENIENELSEKFTEIIGQSDYPELISAAENFVKIFDIYLHYLHESSNEKTSTNFGAVKEALLMLNKQREIFRNKLDIDQLDIINNFSRQQYHSLVTSMNSISIVCDCKKRFAFLGDAPTSVIHHINSSLKDEYKFVKVQHHGTDFYFTQKTPIGQYNSISNGGYERRKVCENFIGNRKVICTSAHKEPQRFCNYYKKNGLCKPNCIKVNLSYKINV